MVLLLVLLALLASLVASEQVTERIILASVNGVPSSEVLFGPHHLLTVSSDASGGLKAIYCVDVTCKTTFSSQIWNSATGLPTILPDTGGRAPVLGFQHSDGQVTTKNKNKRHGIAYKKRPNIVTCLYRLLPLLVALTLLVRAWRGRATLCTALVLAT
jgi:hypothetical protein